MTVPIETKPFKSRYTFAERKETAERLAAKFPDRIPVIIERYSNGVKDTPIIDKTKFLVPRETTIGKFILEVRKHLVSATSKQGSATSKQGASEKAIFIFVKGGVLPPSAAIIDHVHNRYKDEDGFLYIQYTSENTFG
jgi:GABA(A) receptor-associated protein